MSSAGVPLVSDLVKERPRRARVFEKFGISYCSSGKKSLEEACETAGVNPETLRAELLQCDLGASAEERNWSEVSLTELADHIEATHHVFLRAALPRLATMLDKVVKVHGHHRPELAEVKTVFAGLKAELDMHMMKEEQILFPMFRQLETVSSVPEFHCGSVQNPIRVMEHEHSDAKGALARMRQLTSDYTPPEGACATYCTMLDSLAELESDLHVHIYKEDEVLFPRGTALEESLRR